MARNRLLRFLWCEAVGHAVCKDAELKRFYRHKLMQKGLGMARLAAARKLGIWLWILLRDQIEYQGSVVVGSCDRSAVIPMGECLIVPQIRSCVWAKQISRIWWRYAWSTADRPNREPARKARGHYESGVVARN